MDVSLTRLSRSWWGGKEKEQVSNGSMMNSVSDWGGFGLRDSENLKFGSVMSAEMVSSSSSSSRKVKKKWKSREERWRRIDKEYDAVLVPSDGVCLSGSESDDSDWSIGWLERLSPDFQSDDKADDSFAVLVPCYSQYTESEKEPSHQFFSAIFSAIENLPNEYSAEGKKYMEPFFTPEFLKSLKGC